MPFRFVERGHLGGYILADADHPHGDPATYCPLTWRWLVEKFKPRTVIDVGCGEGHAVKWFLENADWDAGTGRRHPCYAMGVEGCPEALTAGVVPPHHILIHDYTRGPLGIPRFAGRFDLVWSCEFVEHVEERYADNFLQTFDMGRVVCMTHATPGQPGWHHVHCRPAEYWLGRLAARGFHHEEALTQASRLLEPGTHWARSGLIFTRDGTIH